MLPYLFVLGMEVFFVLMDKAVRGVFLSGYTFKGRDGNALTLHHLLCADDTLIFCKYFEEQLVYLNWVLLCFEVLLGLKIIFGEKRGHPSGRGKGNRLASGRAGCNIGYLPSTYLSLPLGARFNAMFIWEGVEEKFKRKLAI